MTDVRDDLISRLTMDLVGPIEDREEFRDKPSDRYLTGILFAQRQLMGADEDERLEVAAGGSDEEEAAAGIDDQVPTSFMKKPSAFGLSFRCAGSDAAPALECRVTGGRYVRSDLEGSDAADENAGEEGGEATAERKPTGTKYKWSRSPVALEKRINVGVGTKTMALDKEGLPRFTLHQTASRVGQDWLVTVVLVNANKASSNTTKPDELALFQATLEIRPLADTRIVARNEAVALDDEDGRINELLYRNVRQFAVGHTCGATWEEKEDQTASVVATTWLPQQRVPLVSSEGSPIIQAALEGISPNPLDAETLAGSRSDLEIFLDPLVNAYEEWIKRQHQRVNDLPPELQPVAEENISRCRRSAQRMRDGIGLLRKDALARSSFRLMNRAMTVQRRWTSGNHLQWRPFQIAFILQAISSIADEKSSERDVMDLLWFPTGGGKTEAYLGLIAFTLFLRRLKRRKEPDRGGGTACIMRYTLRLLTLQQFQRAAALTLACEFIRQGNLIPEGVDSLSDTAPVGIGLWVGKKATARNYPEAAEALRNPSTQNTPAQLTTCPCCKSRLKWEAIDAEERLSVRCLNKECELGAAVPELPVFTIDPSVYSQRPSLIIGTIDKFAQIVRFEETASIFNAGTSAPPDLIIQDELHLISGPLGTLAAVYEAAIDLICSRSGYRPKIIGSTATIRRASDQVKALFDRSVAQFPPPGIDAEDSCFAVVPTVAKNRLYVGVTTAGRSAKFTLQGVFASLAQASTGVEPADVRDGYHTVVGYFNSLRELGGALVLVQDDVSDSITIIAKQRKEPPRKLGEIVELTSRVSQRQIRDILDQLELNCGNDASVDVVLATNMLSVGVDVGRLALMVVLGQPKSIAEYIQATSRVGRQSNQGLIVTVLNNAKTRDRSRFETFEGWHQAMYRGVEATSVTPWASRARDRGLHAALVAVARHLVPGMESAPTLSASALASITDLASRILERVDRIDPEERAQTEKDLRELIDQWRHRAPGLDTYWNDFQFTKTLMIGAERAAARNMRKTAGQPWPTPNSMRSVEAGTPFRLAEGLRGTRDATTE